MKRPWTIPDRQLLHKSKISAMVSPPASPPQDKDILSIPATWLYRLGLPLLTSTLYIYSPATALAVPFVAAPTVALLYQRSKAPPADRPGNLENLIWAFLGAATVAPAVCITLQSALSYGTALLMLGDRTSDYIKEFTREADDVRSLSMEMVQKRAAMAHSWRYIAYLTLFSFSMAGLPEEAMKYSILKYIEYRHSNQSNTKLTAREFMLYAATVGLGFSFVENLGFIYAAAVHDTRNMMLVTAAERILYGTTAHVFTAILTGARMAKATVKDASGEKASNWLQITMPSLLYHGAGDAALLGACAWDGHPGFVHPQTVGKFATYIVAPIVLMTGLGMQIAREVRGLGVSWFGV